MKIISNYLEEGIVEAKENGSERRNANPRWRRLAGADRAAICMTDSGELHDDGDDVT